MTKLTILRGLSGSGKSTWAESQAGNPVVVSRDRIRASVFGSDDQDYYQDPNLRKKEDLVTAMQDAAIEEALRAGMGVIVDNTNIEWRFVTAIAAIGYRVGAEVETKTFDVPLSVAVERNEKRAAMGGRNVPLDVIKKQHSRFQGSKVHALEPPFAPVAYNGTPGKPKAFLYDLDGTVFHMNGKRGPYDLNVEVDDVDKVIAHIVDVMACFLVPIAMSGRKEAARVATENALSDYDIPFEHLFMRANDDNRKDSLVKTDLFNEHVRDNFDVQFVLDDRNQVVKDCWRAMGLKCLQVEDGDF